MLRAPARALPLAAALALAGCIHDRIEPPTPSFASIVALREAGVPALGVGPFRDGVKGGARSVSIRGSSVSAPKGSDFGQFLGTLFRSELEAAGKFDAASPLQLTGTLTESGAGENFRTGGAALAADIVLMRAGRPVFSKTYRRTARWDSDFFAALAVPEAFNQYTALYQELAREVLTDPAFIAAAKGVSRDDAGQAGEL